MKEELQSKLVEILTSIQTAAGKASDFAMEQLPDIAQSYLLYGRALHTSVFVACILALALGWWAAFRIHAARKAEGGSRYDPFYIFFPLSMVSVFPVVAVAITFPSLLLVWFAPKVWLLKEIASLLK